MSTKLSLKKIQACLKPEERQPECKQILLGNQALNFLQAELKAVEHAESEAALARTNALNLAQVASKSALNALLAQRKLIIDTQNSLSTAEAALSKSGHDTVAPQGIEAWKIARHRNPSTVWVGDCTWRLSPHSYIDQACMAKRNAMQNDVNRLKEALKLAQEGLPDKEAAQNKAETSFTSLHNEKDDFYSKKIQAVLDELAETQADQALDCTGATDALDEEI